MTSSSAPSSLFARMGGRPRLLHLLRHFYADVRQHREIGPIFTAKIMDWPAHLEKIADFWSNVTGGPVRYEGPMPQRHFPLGLEPHHFEAWLDLWRRHCRAHLAPAEAEEMIAAAEGIGDRLRFLVAQRKQAEKSAEIQIGAGIQGAEIARPQTRAPERESSSSTTTPPFQSPCVSTEIPSE